MHMPLLPSCDYYTSSWLSLPTMDESESGLMVLEKWKVHMPLPPSLTDYTSSWRNLPSTPSGHPPHTLGPQHHLRSYNLRLKFERKIRELKEKCIWPLDLAFTWWWFILRFSVIVSIICLFPLSFVFCLFPLSFVRRLDEEMLPRFGWAGMISDYYLSITH